jgi:hypothetical protein
MEFFPIWEHLTVGQLKGRLNELPRMTLRMLRPGPGIRLFPSGDGGVCIAVDDGGRGRAGAGGGGGGGGLYMGKFSSLDSNGSTMQVYLWNWSTSAYDSTTTTVRKPEILIVSSGTTIEWADGTEGSATTTGVNARYQRNLTIDAYTETQNITPMYATNEVIYIERRPDGVYIDKNQAGRNWGALET